MLFYFTSSGLPKVSFTVQSHIVNVIRKSAILHKTKWIRESVFVHLERMTIFSVHRSNKIYFLLSTYCSESRYLFGKSHETRNHWFDHMGQIAKGIWVEGSGLFNVFPFHVVQLSMEFYRGLCYRIESKNSLWNQYTVNKSKPAIVHKKTSLSCWEYRCILNPMD